MQQTTQMQSCSIPELRSAKRHLLLYRTAKIRMGKREFLCLLRNVSEAGFAIRVLGNIVIEPDCVLELSNGAAYPARLAWQLDDSAGFQFEQPVDTDQFIAPSHDYKSRPIRLNVNCLAWVSTGYGKSNVDLIDVSVGGAKLRAADKLYVGEVFMLCLEGLGIFEARVCWSNFQAVGVMFTEPLKFALLAEWSTAWAALPETPDAPLSQPGDPAAKQSRPFAPPANYC